MTKKELMNAITGLPAKTQVYKIDDVAQKLPLPFTMLMIRQPRRV